MLEISTVFAPKRKNAAAITAHTIHFFILSS
jgi:hypothetical protein